MKKSLLLFVFFFSFFIGKPQCPVLNFINPSFEGTPQPHVSPAPWTECMPGQTPDTQPGSWGITLSPTNGNTYLGLVAQPSTNWQEGASEQLSSPFIAGTSYSFAVDVANLFGSFVGSGIIPGCAELQIWGGFEACDDSAGTGELLWSSGNISPYDTWITDTVTFTPTQNFTWTMFRVNSLGCSDGPYILVDNIRSITNGSVNNSPDLNISDTSFVTCPGSNITLGGVPTANCRYDWSGGGLNSLDVNPVVSPTSNTIYHVLLTDTLTNCITLGNTLVEVSVPPTQTICLVTVDSASTHNIVTWEKLDKAATDSFYIFREISTNNYSQIAAIPRDSLSEYHDYGSDPNITAYRYKISVLDTCLNRSSLSPYHNTLHLQYLGGGNLLWNTYEIENQTTPVSTFDVYRDTIGNGNWQIIATVPGGQYTFTDVTFSQHPNAIYRISANFSYSCTPTRSITSSLSNIVSVTVNDIANVFPEHLIRIYPNPANNTVTISVDENMVGGTITITDLTGRRILVSNIEHAITNIDISSLASGCYIAEVQTKDVAVKKRWVKM